MAAVTYAGTGAVSDSDFKAVTWTGKDKGGNSVVITFANAINMGDIDWTFADKDDTVAAVTFTACYANTDAASTTTTEPYTITINGSTAGAAEILLGAGVFSIGGVDVALTRGGGQFTAGRVYREINADGDRGAVKGRVVMDEARPTLTLNALTFLTRVADLYPALAIQV